MIATKASIAPTTTVLLLPVPYYYYYYYYYYYHHHCMLSITPLHHYQKGEWSWREEGVACNVVN